MDNIRDTLSGKVSDRQAQRFVVNLNDSPASFDDVRAVLKRKPIAGLNHVIGVKAGHVVQLYP